MSLKKNIEELAVSHGADLVGIAAPDVYLEYLEQTRTRLQETDATGHDYMLPTDAMTFFENLSDARHTLADAKSIIILGAYVFDQNCDYKETMQKRQGKTARTYYYYPVVRQIAEQVVTYLKKDNYKAIDGQHIPLKHVAHSIGLGSYGWNGILCTKKFGSYIALRDIITDAELEPDSFKQPVMPCENCGKCIKACPTGALYAPYKVNPKLCINPLTRKNDDIPKELRHKMENWLCGCDICQEVCPMNQPLKPRTPDHRACFDPANHGSHRTLSGLEKTPGLYDLIQSQSALFEIQRSAVIALGNIGDHKDKEFLFKCKNSCNKKLEEYVSWAVDQITERERRR